MNKLLLKIIVGVTIFFTFFVILRNGQLLKIDNEVDNIEWKLKRNTILLYESIYQNMSLLPIENISDNALDKFYDYVTKEEKLIVLVPADPCRDCITKELTMIRSLSKRIGQNRILFLTQFSENRKSKLWKKTWDIEFPIYNNSGQRIFSNIQDKEFIALFVLDSTMIPKHLFIPITNLPDLSERYYKFVNSLFASSDTTRNKVSFDKLRHDFGNIKYGEPQSATFILTNNGNSPLVINNIETTCGCTVPTWDKSPISPNSSSEITVLYKADKTGFFQQKIFVYSNAKNSPQGLIITGNVENQ